MRDGDAGNAFFSQPGHAWSNECECSEPYNFHGARRARAYIIKCEDELYPIKASALVSYFPSKGKQRKATR